MIIFPHLSNKLKEAIEQEIDDNLDKETKRIKKENERLQAEVIRLVQIVKRRNEEDKLKKEVGLKMGEDIETLYKCACGKTIFIEFDNGQLYCPICKEVNKKDCEKLWSATQ